VTGVSSDRMRTLILALVGLFGICACERWSPRKLGEFDLAHAGFIELFTEDDGQQCLYFTTFNAGLPFFHDSVYYLRNPGSMLDSVAEWDKSIQQLGGKSTAFWPNYPVYMPKEVTGLFEGIVQTSGFLVPGKNAGRLEVFDTTSGTPEGPWDIAAGAEHDWSYHWVLWKDVDNDGLIDAMTARFRVPLLGGDPIREFGWLKNLGQGHPGAPGNWRWPWTTLIETGPDVYFEEQILESEGIEYSVILTSELWSERVMLYFVENVPGAWDSQEIRSVVVDSAPGQPFECHMADLNNDGTMEIIASAYDTRKGNETGNLWAYERVGDWTTPEGWSRRSLISGFVANPYLFGNSMTPGKQRLFYPSVEYQMTPNELGNLPKPWIALSGDDDGVHYILYPMSEELDNWEYEMEVMVDTEETTAGTMAVADLDGDGYVEVISAGYTKGRVYVFTFAP